MDGSVPATGSWSDDNSIFTWHEQYGLPRQQQRRQRLEYSWQPSRGYYHQLQLQQQQLQLQQHLLLQQQLQLQLQLQEHTRTQHMILRQQSHFLQQLNHQEQQLPGMLRGLLDFRFDRIVQVVKREMWRGHEEMMQRVDRCTAAAADRAIQRRVKPELAALHTQGTQAEALSTNILTRVTVLETGVAAIARSLDCDGQLLMHQRQRQNRRSSGDRRRIRSLSPKQQQRVQSPSSNYHQQGVQLPPTESHQSELPPSSEHQGATRSQFPALNRPENPPPSTKLPQSESFSSRPFNRQETDSHRKEQDGENTMPKELYFDSGNEVEMGPHGVGGYVKVVDSQDIDAQDQSEECAYQTSQYVDGEETTLKCVQAGAHIAAVFKESGMKQLVSGTFDRANTVGDKIILNYEPFKGDQEGLGINKSKGTVTNNQSRELRKGPSQEVTDTSQRSGGTDKAHSRNRNTKGVNNSSHRNSETSSNKIAQPSEALQHLASDISRKQSNFLSNGQTLKSNNIDGKRSYIEEKPRPNEKAIQEDMTRKTLKEIGSKLVEGEKAVVAPDKTQPCVNAAKLEPQSDEDEKDVENEAGRGDTAINEDKNQKKFPQPCSRTTCVVFDGIHSRYTFDLHIQDFISHFSRPGSEVSSTVCRVQSLHVQGSVWFLSKKRLQTWFVIHKTDKGGSRDCSEGDSDDSHLTKSGSEEKRGRTNSAQLHRTTAADANLTKTPRSEMCVSKAKVKATLIDPYGKLSEMSIGHETEVRWDQRKGRRLEWRLGHLRYEDIIESSYTRANAVAVRFSIEMVTELSD